MYSVIEQPFMRGRLILSALLLLWGGAGHFLLLQGYRKVLPQADKFLSNRLTLIVFPLLGAVIFAFFFMRLAAKLSANRSRSHGWIVAESSLYGMLVVLLTIQGFYLLTAPYITWEMQHGSYPAPSFGTALFATILMTQTYGLVPMILSIPFGLVNGFAGGLLLVSLRNYIPPLVFAKKREAQALTACIVGIAGLLFCWLPLTGSLANMFAVGAGIAVLTKRVDGKVPGRAYAIAAIIMGMVGLLTVTVLLDKDWGNN